MPPWASPIFSIFSHQPFKKKRIFARNIFTINTILIQR